MMATQAWMPGNPRASHHVREVVSCGAPERARACASDCLSWPWSAGGAMSMFTEIDRALTREGGRCAGSLGSSCLSGGYHQQYLPKNPRVTAGLAAMEFA
jgi:hypothetical protein